LGAASPFTFGHCPHPSNQGAKGFTDRPIARMVLEAVS
jgi:hypothetical protein